MKKALQKRFLKNISGEITYGVTDASNSSSTRILPQFSQTMIFFRWRTSLWRCGGIALKQPPQASRTMGTTDRPFT
jgi:hypothetical protein